MTKFLEKYPISILVILGLMIRILYYLNHQNPFLTNDSQTYIDLANLISQGSIKGYFGGRSPGYSLLISLLGNALQFVVWVQMLLGILSSVIWFKILKHFKFQTIFSLSISLIFSTFFHVLAFENTILIETLNLFFCYLINLLYHKK